MKFGTFKKDYTQMCNWQHRHTNEAESSGKGVSQILQIMAITI